ncbi:aspartate aminotransferase family protein [Sulfitobacter mediterraneus]|uniref:aminotransferase family protein n=1 Tax=Sulfitobacter mediterraneus TaxID=83219 RepID=UPI0019319B75|nr:aspartate aminotransferase family protein [Sulfitobacter mediterraneus]MBM1634916.1 aspartate aminotransferase family protein [Sulfitobacter mediterraneus]MBM1642795.1 aspartate aminotransferase family protein [Sulfitobacter mediterraneus]MBM1646843.1 aspartate aminotransferase family protein [Sulfitobacter mediterraneus]MBM1650829.1 aspartate aminotransferase family protein [Sulfitobacter mediterraneus]MBM1654911.1 aspartate aminotransferase family protein [Sulfitobacter mediterraneus]
MTDAPSYLFYQSRNPRPFLDRGEGIYLFDEDGKRYIDGSSGAMVSNIGHSNPRVLAKIKAQMDKATFGYRLHFRTHPSEDLAAKTVAMTPEGLDRVFFVSGGSEAVESALKLARQYALTQGQGSRSKVISRFPSYHGCTLGALDLTGYDPLRAPFAPMMKGMPSIPAPATYLDRDNLSEEARGLKYAEMLRDKIIEEGAETVLAFLMEPVGGASTGALVAPDSYYGRIREICDEFGVLLIYDEVMTGAGRTGKFLAAEHWGITPDIVAMSKGFGAGYAPLGAIVAGARLVEPVLDAGGFLHGFTYAGNPLACSAGLAVLEEMEDQGLIENAAKMGEVLMARLRGLMERYPFIGDVRGKGLLTAFEFVSDRETMEPLPPSLEAHARLVELAYERGLIIYSRRTRGGTAGDHFLLAPPLIITEAQIDEMMTILCAALDAFAAEAGLPVEGAR